jgi:hypothetical protein
MLKLDIRNNNFLKNEENNFDERHNLSDRFRVVHL